MFLFPCLRLFRRDTEWPVRRPLYPAGGYDKGSCGGSEVDKVEQPRWRDRGMQSYVHIRKC